jgi:hypothetical protein
MDQEVTLSEHKVRREIARSIFQNDNEDEALLYYPYCHENIRSVAKVVNLSEEETRSILQSIILERWYGELFKPINDFFEGINRLWMGFEYSEDEEEIIPDTIFNPWFKGHLQDFLTRFEKEYERSASDEDEQSI